MKKHFKQITAVLTAILVFVCVLPLAAESKRSAVEIWDGSIAEGFGGGTGAKTDPYRIENGSELAYLAQQVNAGGHKAFGI